jgi:hypothetical protein
MKAMLFIFLLFCCLPVLSQQDSWDSALTETLIDINKKTYPRHTEYRNLQLQSTLTMKAVHEKKKQFKELVDNINKRLNNVFIVAADVTIVYDAYKRLKYLIELEGKVIDLAVKYPLTIPIAASTEKEIVEDAKDLYGFISVIVLSWGDVSKMKNSNRQIIFRNVTDILSLMIARLESTYQLLKRYDLKEILRKTGIPFYDYYTQDKKIVEGLLKNF